MLMGFGRLYVLEWFHREFLSLLLLAKDSFLLLLLGSGYLIGFELMTIHCMIQMQSKVIDPIFQQLRTYLITECLLPVQFIVGASHLDIFAMNNSPIGIQLF